MMVLNAVAGIELSIELEGLSILTFSMRGSRISGDNLGVKAPRLVKEFERQPL